MQDTLAEKTYQQLRRKVLRGELQPGDQLVNRTLAEEMGVSLAPVREAIHRLATEGLVQHVPGAGAFVPKLTRQDLEELYVLREALESCAAGEAARQIGGAELDELDAICRDAEAITEEIRGKRKQIASDEQFDRWLDKEEMFHALLIEAARNRMLKKAIVRHRALTRIFEVQRHRTAILTLAVAEETCRGHAEMVAALRKRDSDLVRQLMSAHIRRGRQTVMEFFHRLQREQDS